MKKKVTAYFCLAIFVTALFLGISSYSITKSYYKKQVEENMLSYTAVLQQDDAFLSGDDQTAAQKYAKLFSCRVTVISKDGSVLYDSDSDTTENHENRPEVVAARKDGTSFLSRYSDTEHATLYYAAAVCSNGIVVRLSRVQQVMDEGLHSMAIAMLICVGICMVVAVLLILIFANRMVRPMAKLRDHMKQNTEKEELIPIDTHGLHHEVLELSEAYNDLIDTLNHQMQEIKELQNMRSEFVANVSHELKTPLTSIRGFVETLKAGAIYKEDVAMRFLNIIDIEADRLQNLISDTLFLSKIEKMGKEDTAQLFCLTGLAREVLELVDMQSREKGVEMLYDPPCEVWINADADKIKQLMLNLVSNAIKYNKEGGNVQVKIRKPKENHVEIQVSDTGIGMNSEDLERVFERFYRVDKGRSQKNGGTGLGLSIVKHIANLYGGNVVVESKPGCGSDFLVTLCVETILNERE